MSDAATSGTTWPALGVHERRVLGVLVEKAKTSPDSYPLSMNALVVGSNQKSAREPVLELTDLDVENALATLQQHGLVTRIQGGRVEKWRHNLYDLWKVNKVELAVLAELLLRGPQSEGELRGRASRMEPIADLEALRALLRPLVERGLVVFLGPEGRRGTLIAHGFHSAKELDHAQASRPAEPPPTERAPAAVDDLAAFRTEIASLRAQVSDLQNSLAQVTEQLHTLKQSLGA